MEVRELDGVVVDDPQPADARADQIRGDGRAERARPDDQHGGVAQAALLDRAPALQHELAAVAVELGRAKAARVRRRRWRRDEIVRDDLFGGRLGRGSHRLREQTSAARAHLTILTTLPSMVTA